MFNYFRLCLLECFYFFFFFKQKTAYEMLIGDWISDVCSSDLFRDGDSGGERPPPDPCPGKRAHRRGCDDRAARRHQGAVQPPADRKGPRRLSGGLAKDRPDDRLKRPATFPHRLLTISRLALPDGRCGQIGRAHV